MSNADMVTRVYSNFRGCDFRGLEVNLLRSPDCLNVWKDYKETESIRTRPETEIKNLIVGKEISVRLYPLAPSLTPENFSHISEAKFSVERDESTEVHDWEKYICIEEDSNGVFYVAKADYDAVPWEKLKNGSTIYFDSFDTNYVYARMVVAEESTDAVYGIFFYGGNMIAHIGDALYKFTDGFGKLIWSGVNRAVSNSFIYDDVFYFKDGENYLRYDGENIKRVEGYIPTTTIARKPSGGGTKYEDVNMMSDYRKNSFLADGGAFSFFLDVMNIDDDFFPEVTVNDEIVPTDEYTVNYAEGSITFNNYAPDAPLTDGQDNVVVKFKKAIPEYRDCIEKCTILQVFDNRVFFSGNPEHPNMVWNSSLNDPSYCSDLDYYREGMDNAAVKGLVAGNNALWVFREPSDANTTVFYHTPSIDDEYGKIYPSAHSSITTGCIGKAINFNDDIVFFSERGMEGISGDITTEQVVAHRSSLVDRKMISEPNYKDMILAEWEGYLLVFIGNKVYLADSRATFTNENHFEYEWFMWELKENVICATVKDGVLYIGTNGGIYTLTDKNANVESYWVTPLDKFKYPHKLKTTNKRGCVAEATGDISVYAKLEDTDFELIGDYKNITDYFVSRIKRKKFKDIQLKFHSNTRFSLETVTLECFIGGYIKR